MLQSISNKPYYSHPRLIKPTVSRYGLPKIIQTEQDLSLNEGNYVNISLVDNSKSSLKMLQKIQNYPFARKRLNNRNEVIKSNAYNDENLEEVHLEGDDEMNNETVVGMGPVMAKLSESEKMLLNTEMEMLKLDRKLRESLSVHSPNHGEALNYLNLLHELNVTELMLKKNPQIVDAIRKCARYKFDNKIRSKAEAIYCSFRSILPQPNPNDDWKKHFDETVQEFIEACKLTGIRKEMLVFLVQDPTQLFDKGKKMLKVKSNPNVSITKVDNNIKAQENISSSQNLEIPSTSCAKIVGRVQPSRFKKMNK